MRRNLILGCITLLFLLALGFQLSGARSPAFQVAGFLHAAGFTPASLPEPVEENAALVFKDIALDENGFSTIKSIAATTNWRGAVDTLEIKGLRLNGDLTEDMTLSIAGYDPTQDLGRHPWARAPATISFDDARLSILTPHLGGVDIPFEIQLRKNKKLYDLQAVFESSHSALSFDARAQGTVTTDGFWQSKIDIEAGKFDFGALKATRLSGQIQIAGQSLQSSDIVGELQAGALMTINLPWQNAAIGLSGPLSNPQANISAKSAGHEGLEIGLEIGDLTQPASYILVVNTAYLGSLFDILAARDGLPFDAPSLAPIATQKNYDFVIAGSPAQISFEVNRDNRPVILGGLIKPQNGSSADILQGAPFDLSLQAPEGTLTGALRYDPQMNQFVSLPEEKPLRPKLNTSSQIIDIFR